MDVDGLVHNPDLPPEVCVESPTGMEVLMVPLGMGVGVDAGEDPLLLASCEGDLTAVIALLASFKIRGDCSGEIDCLVAACARGHVNIVNALLLSETCDPSAHKNLALQLAVMYAHPAVVEMLLKDSRVDPSEFVYLIELACGENHDIDWFVRFLTDYEVPGKPDSTPLRLLDSESYHLTEGGVDAQIQVVTMLIQDNRVLFPEEKEAWIVLYYDVGEWRPWREKYNGWRCTQDTLLPWAVKQGSVELVRLLLDDKRACPKEALGVAAENGHLEMVRMFMADPRIEKELRDTYFCKNTSKAMSRAAHSGHLDVVSYFMTQDQKVSQLDVQAAIANAAAMGHVDVLNYLFQDKLYHLPSAHRQNVFLQTAFLAAAKGGQLELMKTFIASDGGVLLPGYEAAISAAAKAGNVDVVGFLTRAVFADTVVEPGQDDISDGRFNWFLNDTFNDVAAHGRLEMLKRIMADKQFFLFPAVHNKVLKTTIHRVAKSALKRTDFEEAEAILAYVRDIKS